MPAYFNVTYEKIHPAEAGCIFCDAEIYFPVIRASL
jgi:deoxyhypusine synthase